MRVVGHDRVSSSGAKWDDKAEAAEAAEGLQATSSAVRLRFYPDSAGFGSISPPETEIDRCCQ